MLGDIPLGMLQHPGEIEPFAKWLEETVKPRVVLEIGTGPGGLTILLGRIASETVLTIDLPCGASSGLPYEGCVNRNAVIKQALGEKFLGVLGDSHDPELQNVVRAALRGQPVDVLFVDGDHTYEGVRADFRDYAPLVRLGGFVAFHDINAWPFTDVHVPRFWQELDVAGKFTFSVGADWGGIGVVQV